MYKKLVKPALLGKKIFEAKMHKAFSRLKIAKNLLDGKSVGYGLHEEALFDSRAEFDEFVRNVISAPNATYNPTHIYTYSEFSDCYRCKDQRWGFPFGVKLLIEYIQFEPGQSCPHVIDLGAV